ncbi:MAG: NAD(P)-binding protein, partial [Bdellovibrionota bacterium]
MIGAGPAGLTAGFFLAKAGVSVVVLESDPADVGGISRTVTFNGFGFDIGGHRFFSKSKEVEEFWSDLLPRDLLVKRRTSRIFYRNKFYSYPLRPVEALRKLGIFEAALCIFSYIRAKVNSPRKPRNFEEWISKQFGHRLFRIFFKSYTEKVWGLPCSQISADWAAQRIKGLSPKSILLHGLFPSRKDEGAKTLQETFRYPRKGPGMMWEACARRIREMGGSVLMGHRVERAEYDQVKKKWRVFCAAPGTCELSADHLISSAAIGDLLPRISPSFSPASKAAAASLKYRDFIIVGLVMNGAELFSDNWLYIHDPSVRMGRIQNFKSWSIE